MDASKAETDYSSHYSESVELDISLFSSIETPFNSRSSIHPSHLEVTKIAERLQLAKESLASNAIRHYSPSLCP